MTWNPLFPPTLVGLCAGLLALLAMVAAWRTRHSWPAWANLCALALRAIALCCAGILILRPESVAQLSHSRRPSLLLLVDDSASLALRDAPPGSRASFPTRSEMGQPALARLLAGASAANWTVRAYDVGARLQPRDPALSAIGSAAPCSALGDLLAEACQRVNTLDPGGPGAIVFFTDGCANRGRDLASAATELARRQIPLFPILLGRAYPLPPDAQLSELTIRSEQADPEAGTEPCTGEQLQVEARAWLNQGLPRRTRLSGPLADTQARLQILPPPPSPTLQAPQAETPPQPTGFVEADSLRHRLEEHPAWTTVRLSFRPKFPGTYRVRLSLDPFQGEEELHNNAAYALIQVRPPASEVLYVSSSLNHNYRHLKRLFSTWPQPAIQLVSDFVLPDPSPAALPRWPAQEALGSRLHAPPRGRRLALLWEDPRPSHLAPETQVQLRAALAAGKAGAVWMMSSTAAQLGAHIRSSPLEDAFLFQEFLAPDPVPQTGPPAPVVNLTSAGRQHPITSWLSTDSAPGANLQVLACAPLAGRLAKPRPGVEVLLECTGQPLLSAAKIQEGRVLLWDSAAAWRWFAPALDQPAAQTRLRLASELLQRMLAWIAGDDPPGEPPVRIHLATTRWALGENLQGRVAVLGAPPTQPLVIETALAPLPHDLRQPPSAWRVLGEVPLQPSAQPGNQPPGGPPIRTFFGTFGTPSQAGEWLLSARARTREGQILGQDLHHLTVGGRDLETSAVLPDEEGLARAAARAGPGSRVLAPKVEEIDALIRELGERMKPVTEVHEQRTPAISEGGLLLLFLLSLLVDTWLRRSA